MSRKGIKDLVLPKGSYVYLLDNTDGDVKVLVGPTFYRSVDETDAPVVWNPEKNRIRGCQIEQAIQSIVVIPERSYAVVHNPARDQDGRLVWPTQKVQLSSSVNLGMGTDAVVRGPGAFIPWPGQDIEVRAGHDLKADQYLVVQRPCGRTVIQGPQFFIPEDDEMIVAIDKQLVHKAVQLGAFQWCATVDDAGKIRYHYGKDETLVFPQSNEQFATLNFAGKPAVIHEAIQLDGKGVAVMVMEDIVNEEDESTTSTVAAGTKLFFTKADMPLYWPHVSHRLSEIVQSHVIPIGERHYLVSKIDGAISTIDGRATMLVNPWESTLVKHPTVPTGIVEVLATDVIKIENIANCYAATTRGPANIWLGYDDRVVARDRVQRVSIATTRGNLTADGIEVDFEVLTTVDFEEPRWFTDAINLVVDSMKDAIDLFIADQTVESLMDDIQINQGLRDVIAKALDIDDLQVSRIEVLRFSILTNKIYDTIRTAQIEMVDAGLALKQAELTLKVQQSRLAIEDKKTTADVQRNREAAEIKRDLLEQANARNLRAIEIDAAIERTRVEEAIKVEELHNEHAALVNYRESAVQAFKDTERLRAVELEQQRIDGQADAQVKILGAISPELTAALELHGKATMFKDVLKNLGPAAMVKDVPVMEFAQRMLAGSALEGVIASPAAVLTEDGKNGKSKARPTV